MPITLIRYLRRHSLSFHLCRALIIGFTLRSLSAYFVYGPQALDDYKHGVWPAFQIFSGQIPDLPPYRSHLLVWLLVGFIDVAHFFGLESALSQVRAMYFGLGVLSLLAIYGASLYASCFRSRIFGGLAVYLLAVYPLMPFASTRAFGESVALTFVVLGLAICEHARLKTNRSGEMALGFFVIGVAALFRFQVGVIYLAYAGTLLFFRHWRFLGAMLIAGLALLVAQAYIDIWSDKTPFATLQAYILENEGGAAKYGVSPWYNTWALIFGMTLFPFSLVFLLKLKQMIHRHLPACVSLFAFVFIHSIVAHKEERFMYPILGLLLILLAYVWTLARHSQKARQIYSTAYFVVSLLTLPIACFVNSQAGEIEPAAIAQDYFGSVAYIDHESLFQKSMIQFYFLRPPSQILPTGLGGLNLGYAEEVLKTNTELRGVEILTSVPAAFAAIESLSEQSSDLVRCGKSQIATSMVDRLLYRLNPKHNQRRRPTYYILCERK
jgi:phosphatidylinositol glycan class B